jgi:hypothetical protein
MKARFQWLLAMILTVIILLPLNVPARDSAVFQDVLTFRPLQPSLQLTLIPPDANEAVHYIFTYELKALHKAHDWIEILFPAGTRFDPPIPEKREDSIPRLRGIIESLAFENHLYTIGCHVLLGLPIITKNEDQSISLRFNFDFDMDPTEELWKTLTIHVLPEAGIVTPPQSGTYTYAIRCKSSPEWQYFDPVTIHSRES